MAHQCVHCGALYKNDAPEVMGGCCCGSRLFLYIRVPVVKKTMQEMLGSLKNELEHCNRVLTEIMGQVKND